MKQLNNVILKEIFIYLLYKCKFNDILEYSFISKSVFKLFQNIISTRGNITEIILPIKTLYEYIQTCDDDDNSHLKLIQLDKIEYIKSSKNSKKRYEQKRSTSSLYQENRILALDNNFKIKQYFTMKCKNLKTIHWIDKFKLSENTEFTIDQSLSGFFKFDSLSILWNSKCKPISNDIEAHELKSQFNHSDYKYSFKFLDNYNKDQTGNSTLIKKLIISTTSAQKKQTTYPVYKLDGILNNCKFIQSIKFIDHPTPPSFLNQLLSNPNSRNSLTSLSIGIDETFDKDSSVHSIVNVEERDNFINNLFSSNENQLKKLIISGIRVTDLKRFTQSIVNGNVNQTLETIGLFNGNILLKGIAQLVVLNM